MITRRGLLQGILAAGIAPAIGTAGIIMPPRNVIVPSLDILTGTEVLSRQELIDLRARAQLAAWHADRCDRIMYQILLGGST